MPAKILIGDRLRSDAQPVPGFHLVDVELLNDQKKELSQILNDYAKAKQGIPDHDVFERKKTEPQYAKKIKELLLPAQLESIAKKTQKDKRLLTLLAYAEYGSLLEITDTQRNKIVSESSTANKKIREVVNLKSRKTNAATG